MPTYKAGKVKNINADIQEHLDRGGRIEMVIQRDGKTVLSTVPNVTDPIQKGK